MATKTETPFAAHEHHHAFHRWEDCWLNPDQSASRRCQHCGHGDKSALDTGYCFKCWPGIEAFRRWASPA